MRTSKTVRNYKYLLITILNFIALLIAKIYYEYIDNLEYNGATNYDYYTDINYKNFQDYKYAQYDILANILFASVILSIILVFTKIKKFKSGLEKLILVIWFIYIISIIVGLIDREMDGGYAYKICKTYLINYLLFIPHLFLIYRLTFLGETVDLSSEIKHNEEKKFSNSLGDLKKLLEQGQISDEEFNVKKEVILKKKIEMEIKLTEEYKLLEKTKDTGLINESEFSLKFKNLIDKKYRESL